MPDTTMSDHLTIAALLPDFVLGKLDETSLRRVSRHVDACPACQRDLTNTMDVLGVLANIPPPPARVRAAILQRAAGERPAAVRDSATPGIAGAVPIVTGGVQWERIAEKDDRRHLPFGQPARRWLLVAASAAVFLVSGLVGWSYDQRNAGVEDDRIAALVNDPTAAYPLDDSDLPVAAAGVVFAEPEGREVYLVANGLPVLPNDQRYQVWLFTTDHRQESAGLLAVGADGEVRALLETSGPFVNYVGVGLTAEPQAGSDMPTSDLVLGGSFPPLIASLLALPG